MRVIVLGVGPAFDCNAQGIVTLGIYGVGITLGQTGGICIGDICKRFIVPLPFIVFRDCVDDMH